MTGDALSALIDRYCAAWRESDAAARAAILEAVWHENGRYCDPAAEVTGRAALGDLIGRVQGRYPGGRVIRLSPVDSHHGRFRFTWCLELADGRKLPESTDFGRLAEDGHISEIVGFFGPIGST